MSENFIKEDQDFLNQLLERVLSQLNDLKNIQLTKLFYNLYGKNLASVEFEYFSDFENLIFER